MYNVKFFCTMYRSHLYRKHSDKQCSDVHLTHDSPEVSSGLSVVGDSEVTTLDIGVKDSDFDAERKRQAALFILKAKEERMI